MTRTLMLAGAMLAFAAGSAAAADKPGNASTGGAKLHATLTGAAEKPTIGDPDGTGTFKATVNPGQGQVCYELEWNNLQPVTAAHIHVGGPNDVGGPVVTLQIDDDDNATDDHDSDGCATVTKEQAHQLLGNPGGFYVNVHTGDFPNGAIRGQLMKH